MNKKLKTYTIKTYATATFEYFVDASSKKNAIKQFHQGWSEPKNDNMPISVHDETIEDITEKEYEEV